MHALFFAVILMVVGSAWSHGLQHSVSDARAGVVKFSYDDDLPVSYAKFELFREGEDDPYQVGWTDQKGQLVFVPETEGDWQVKLFTQDGHGLDLTVAADARQAVVPREKSLFERYERVLMGVALIFGLFGLATLFYRGQRR